MSVKCGMSRGCVLAVLGVATVLGAATASAQKTTDVPSGVAVKKDSPAQETADPKKPAWLSAEKKLVDLLGAEAKALQEQQKGGAEKDAVDWPAIQGLVVDRLFHASKRKKGSDGSDQLEWPVWQKGLVDQVYKNLKRELRRNKGRDSLQLKAQNRLAGGARAKLDLLISEKKKTTAQEEKVGSSKTPYVYRGRGGRRSSRPRYKGQRPIVE